jgi:hypothetical protein
MAALSGDGHSLHPSPEAWTLERIRAHHKERLGARALIADIMALGLTPELRERSRIFLEDHQD